MRVSEKTTEGFRVKAISGIHTVLIALDCAEGLRKGLLGFDFQRETVGAGGSGLKSLRSQKVFKSVIPDPTTDGNYRTSDFPIQSFLWGDYTAKPDTAYKFKIIPMYGKPGALDPHPALTFEIRTEKEFDQGHGVWFNRGAIASQAFAREFGNKSLTGDEKNNPDFPETKWLSRGLIEACLKYINETPAGDGLRVAAYEFTYPPVLNALASALERGVDVQIVYHDTTDAGSANETAMTKAGLPINDQKITYRRSNTKIPHNKFIVRLAGGTKPTMVWTGSTNFTWSGFIGQTNVGHLVADVDTAKQYHAYWKLVKTDPERDDARSEVMKLTPNPRELIDADSIAKVYSPRPKADLLDWYARRIEDGTVSVMFTAAFGVAKQLAPSIAKAGNALRFVLMEKPAADPQRIELTRDRGHVLLSYGVPLGEMYRMKNGKPTARVRIKDFEIEKSFFHEEHFRKSNDGFVFFVHTKFLLIDPLSDDPLVCSGSANFSSNSLLQNDENMLLIRGNTRVADIYLTEFDRIFRHFYSRNIINELEAKGEKADVAFLNETDKWTDSYFRDGGIKCNRRKMFFVHPTRNWTDNAGADEKNVRAPAKSRKSAKKKSARTAAKTVRKKVAKKAGAGKKTGKSAARKTTREKVGKKTALKKKAKARAKAK